MKKNYFSYYSNDLTILQVDALASAITCLKEKKASESDIQKEVEKLLEYKVVFVLKDYFGNLGFRTNFNLLITVKTFLARLHISLYLDNCKAKCLLVPSLMPTRLALLFVLRTRTLPDIWLSFG